MIQELLTALIAIDPCQAIAEVEHQILKAVQAEAGFPDARFDDDVSESRGPRPGAGDDASKMLFLGKHRSGADLRDIELSVVVAPIISSLLSAASTYEVVQNMQADYAKMSDELSALKAWISATHAVGRIGRYRFNLSKNFLWWSDQVFEFYGLEPNGNKEGGERFRNSILPEDRGQILASVTTASSMQQPHVFSYRLRRPDGTIRRLLTFMAPEIDGEPGDYFGVNLDVTDNRALAEEIRRRRADLDRVLRLTTIGELFASMTHDLAQPLTAIVASAAAAARWLDRVDPELATARRTLDELTRYRRRAAAIVERLREFAKRSDPVEEPVDISAAFIEVLPLIETEATRRLVVLDRKIETNGDLVLGDKTQLQQLFLSLALAAMKEVRNRDGEQMLVALSADSASHADYKIRATFDARAKLEDPAVSPIGSELWMCEKIARAHGGTCTVTDGDGLRTIGVSLPRS